MTRKSHTKMIIEGDLAAEVDVELLIDDSGWAPYLSLDDAMRLDVVRDLLRRKDIEAATRLSRVFRLVPVAA